MVVFKVMLVSDMVVSVVMMVVVMSVSGGDSCDVDADDSIVLLLHTLKSADCSSGPLRLILSGSFAIAMSYYERSGIRPSVATRGCQKIVFRIS